MRDDRRKFTRANTSCGPVKTRLIRVQDDQVRFLLACCHLQGLIRVFVITTTGVLRLGTSGKETNPGVGEGVDPHDVLAVLLRGAAVRVYETPLRISHAAGVIDEDDHTRTDHVRHDLLDPGLGLGRFDVGVGPGVAPVHGHRSIGIAQSVGRVF